MTGKPPPLSARKEFYNVAFLEALCAEQGYELLIYQWDYDSVDGAIKPHHARRLPVDVQLKCSSRQDIIHEDFISYQLPRKNYEELSDPQRGAPTLLVVMIVQDHARGWCTQQAQHMEASGILYYHKMRGQPEMPLEQDSTVVRLLRQNVLTGKELVRLMNHVNDHGDLPRCLISRT